MVIFSREVRLTKEEWKAREKEEAAIARIAEEERQRRGKEEELKRRNTEVLMRLIDNLEIRYENGEISAPPITLYHQMYVHYDGILVPHVSYAEIEDYLYAQRRSNIREKLRKVGILTDISEMEGDAVEQQL